jgi:hypothetical protein
LELIVFDRQALDKYVSILGTLQEVLQGLSRLENRSELRNNSNKREKLYFENIFYEKNKTNKQSSVVY